MEKNIKKTVTIDGIEYEALHNGITAHGNYSCKGCVGEPATNCNSLCAELPNCPRDLVWVEKINCYDRED